MPIIENLLSLAGYVRMEKAVSPPVVAGASADPFTLWRTQKKVDPAKALEVYTGWVYASIRAIAKEIGSIELRLFKSKAGDDEQIFEHELLNLLSAVNGYQTKFEFFYLVAAYLEATGNAPIYLAGAEGAEAKPDALHLLVPSKVKVLANREAFPPRVDGYEYRLGSKVHKFKPEQIIHVKYPDPNDPFEGIGTVQSIAQWVDADNYAMEFNRRFFLNGARIGGFLESDAAYTPEQLEYLKTSFEAAFKGVENAYKVLALPKGTKYEEGGKTQKDLDFANLMTIMRDRIIAGFTVPRTALGITDDVNRANAEATDYVFAARTIRPIMRFVTDYLNEFLVPRYGDGLYLDFADPVPKDRAQLSDEKVKALGGAPWRSANEVRAEEGLDPIEGGDDVLAPFSLQPLGAPAPAGPVPAKAGNGPRAARTRFAANAKRRQALAEGVAGKAAAEAAALLKEIAGIRAKGAEGVAQLSDEEYEAVYKGFALRVDAYERRHAAAIRDFNADQRREVLGNLGRAVKAAGKPGIVADILPAGKAVDKDALFDMEKDMAAFADLSKPILYDLAGKEGAEAAALLGIDGLDILTPEVRKALDTAIDLLSSSYNETTRDLLKAKLEQGLAEGLSQDELADLVGGVFDYSDEVRALQVARTETFRVANYATQEAWRQSGAVNAQRWYTAADERVCPYCAPMHGKVIGIDEDFFKKGDTVQGDDGSAIKVDYSDVGAPPLHVSCRCYIRPEEISLE
jgi:HK97 family phage portal protein